ncbi:MAG: DUF1761 domain-containing protein [Flavobacteriaceae bacterium]|nr:DUF1761 domain-containing protein [Flavobacteriaceae bacterium]
MDITTLNWLAIILAAVSNFIIGGLWYSPLLFGKSWMEENQLTEEQIKEGNHLKIFGLSLLFSLVMAFNLAIFLNDENTDMSWGATAGFLAGFGWVAMSIFTIGQFERRSTKYMLIHAGYLVISFIVMGLIIGYFH